MAFVHDHILNGRGHGEVGEAFESVRFNPNLMRPYMAKPNGPDSRPVPVVNLGGKVVPIANLGDYGIFSPMISNATGLSKDSWQLLDDAVIKVARERLRAWGDLSAANTFGGFDGMSKTILEHQTIDDVGEALVDMDGITETRGDEPRFQLEGLPLPITHSGFHFSARQIAIGSNSGMPLDTTMAEQAGRRVAEAVEKTVFGVQTGLIFGTAADYGRTPQVYGYTNFPARISDTSGTDPTGANGTTVLNDWLSYRDQLYDNNFYGPFMVYTSTGWDQFLDDEFKTNSDKTLRQRLLEIDGISGIRRLDFLTTDFQVIFVQMTSEVARAVVGMPFTTLQWETKGGMQTNFKVMTISVPQLRADFDDNCGILHAQH